MQTEKSVVESENRYDKLCAENKSGYDGGGLESSETKSEKRDRDKQCASKIYKSGYDGGGLESSETKSEKRDRDKQCASMQEQRQCANREIGW